MTKQKLIAKNPNAFSNYFIEEKIEAGIVLSGTEVKSIRNQSPNLKDSFVEVRTCKTGLEAWLLNAHISPYKYGNIWNHEPTQKRKLLLHAYEIKRLFGAVTQKGYSLIPTRMYFLNGRVKVEIGLGKGKKRHDKREALKKRSHEKEIQQAIKSKNR